MNGTQLNPPTLPQVSNRLVRDAGDKEADFLVLRLLNKRARVRISPEQLDLDALPGQARLFAVANSRGCYVAVIRDFASKWSLISGTLAQLRSTFTSATQGGEIDLTTPTRHPLPGPASFVAYAHNETRIVVALADGSLAVYPAQAFLRSTPANPLHVFPSIKGTSIRKLAPNPGDMSEFVAVLRDVGERMDVLAVEVYDVQNMRSICGWRSGATPNTRPTAISWSAKGKLIALGLASGDIEAFSPTSPSMVKTVVPKVQALQEGTIISTMWLSNTEFYSVYTPPGPPSPDAEHSHFVALFDPKTNQSIEVKVNPPALPFPGLRAPNQFIVLFRAWDAARILLFVGDSASSDIGVLGALGELGTPLHTHWTNLTLEETSQPTVPLDKDMNDTVLVGLEADLTGNEPYRYTGPSGEESDVPPPPVLYAYASDGTLTGWQIVNTNGVRYSGMVTPSIPTVSSANGMDAEPTTTTAPSPTVQAPAMDISTSFGTSSPLAASPMAAMPSGGTSTIGSSGFGAFANDSTKFGQPSFGFGGHTASGTPSAPALASPMPSQRPPSPEEATMDSESDAGAGFGGLSLGSGGDDAAKNKTSSVFGSFGSSSTAGTQSAPSFGSSSGSAFGGTKPTTGFGAFGNQSSSAFGAPSVSSNSSASSPPSSGAFGALKPSTGFGAFSNQSSSFSNSATTAVPSRTQPEAKPVSAFGSSSFGQSSTPQKAAFGQPSAAGQSIFTQPSTPAQPAFGQASLSKSAFGQPAFGQSGFGQPAFGQSSFGQSASDGGQPHTTTGGGFSAFAQAGPSGFNATQPKPDLKPAWASTTGNQSPAHASKTEAKSPSAFGSSNFGQTSFGQPAFGRASTAFDAASNAATPVSGGFGAFSQIGHNGFVAAAAKPDEKSAQSAKPSDEPATPKDETTLHVPPSATQGPPTPNEKPSEASTPVTTPSSKPILQTRSSASTESPFKPAGGAFAQLKASPFGFGKLDTGFGAFGGGVTNASSPFFKAATTPMETPTRPAFAMGTSPFGTSLSTAVGTANKPTFGAPSALGGGRSIVGLPSTPTAQATTTPASTPTPGGGFAAFSSSRSPFGATTSGSQSFSEMLRDKTGQELIQPAKPPKTPEEKKPVSVFTKLSGTSGQGRAKGVESPGRVEENADDVVSLEDEDESDDGASFLSDSEPDAEGSEGDAADERRYLEGEAEREDEEQDEDKDDEEEDEDRDGDGVGDEGDEEEEREDQNRSPAKTPADSKTMLSTKLDNEAERSKLPTLLSQVRPTDSAERKSLPAAVPQRAESTTPPGSPVTVRAAAAPVAPPPIVASSGPSLNLPRGSTRPIRSSPLASKPITGEDDSSEGGQSPPGTPPSSMNTRQLSEGQASQTSRPKTPPLLSSFKSAPIPSASPFSLATPSKATMPVPSALTEGEPLAPTPPPLTLATGSPASPLPLIPTVTPPKPGAFSLSPATSTVPAQPVSGLLKPVPLPNALAGAPSLVASQPSTPTAAPPQPAARGVSLASPTPTGQLPAVTDLQGECEFLVRYLAGEFTRLLPLTQLAARRRVELYKAGLNMAKLDEANNWRVSDLPRLEQLMIAAEKDLAQVKEQTQFYISAIRDIESQLLKASTREEEIVRFNKASQDPDFARMLKTRTLGPEHLEVQNQLRREIRALRERLQQLEGHMQEAKKKLSHLNSGRAALRPPSLSLINGTCNHLEEAIEQSEDVTEELSKRVARLSMEYAPRRSRWEQRVPDEDVKRRAEATPNFAVSTAAALNAEMSANKLKRALLAARKEPLLNTQASSKMPVAQDYVLPDVKAEPETSLVSGKSDDPFTLSGDEYPSPGHRRPKAGKFHEKPIHLKKSVSPTPPPVSAFSWGPLPSVTPPVPSKALPFDLRKPSISPQPSPSPPSLSASWVTDGFSFKKEMA